MNKFVETNKKIATGVKEGYKNIENGVVTGYKNIENGVVEGYKKIEDKFVDTFLKQDGETTEEAKKRIALEQEKLAEQNQARVEESLKVSQEINDKYNN